MKTAIKTFIFSAALLAVALTPTAANACAVCMGASDSSVAPAANGAIFFMIGTVTVVLGCLGGFIFRLALLAKRGNNMLNQLMGQLPNASEHGYLIDNMLETCHWIMLLLFVGWSAFFIFTLIRFHQSRNPRADYHGVKSHFSSHIEFSVVLVEIILLFGFAYPLWARRVNDYPSAKDNPVTIRVLAQQFQWKFHYPGKDGIFGKSDASLINSGNPLGLKRDDPAGQDDIYSPNELHLPVNRPVILEITSMDVIHSFSFPAMRIAQDAIPGLRTPVWFKPVKIGEYQVICGQLCGTNHYNMKADVVVQSEEDYNNWLKDMGPH